jgi:hypothetical protein
MDLYPQDNSNKGYVEQNNNYVPIVLAHNKSYKLTGYFQNPNYFNKYRNKIIDLFSLDGNTSNTINTIYNNIVGINNNKITVSIHVRRSDYIKLQHIHVLQDLSYYKNAIDYMKNKYNNLLFLIFSDDMNWCKSNFSNLDIECIYVDNTNYYIEKDVLDMYLMSKCSHNIISNSTFSWWSAYLNNNENKKISVPNRWYVDDNMNKDATNILDNNMVVI